MRSAYAKLESSFVRRFMEIHRVNKVPELRSPARTRCRPSAEVGRKEARKLKARRYKPWSALARFRSAWLVGWSVVLPTVLGVCWACTSTGIIPISTSGHLRSW